jgi:hypothetical protein
MFAQGDFPFDGFGSYRVVKTESSNFLTDTLQSDDEALLRDNSDTRYPRETSGIYGRCSGEFLHLEALS